MIAAEEPFVAVFEMGEGEEEKRVIAWDDYGDPLVAGDEALVAARAEPGFLRLRAAPELRRAVGIVAADGWRIRWKEDDTTWASEPLAGWCLFDDGLMSALEHAGDGRVMSPVDARAEDTFEVYHPDARAQRN